MEIHDRDRKREYSCEFCGKMFATLGDLKQHSIYHKEPQFICSFEGCTKKFFRSSLLESHKKTHFHRRDVACQLCDKKYFEVSHLQRHVLHFHKKLKFSCELPDCKSKFTRKEKYRSHVLTLHKDLSQDEVNLLLMKIKVMKHE